MDYETDGSGVILHNGVTARRAYAGDYLILYAHIAINQCELPTLQWQRVYQPRN